MQIKTTHLIAALFTLSVAWGTTGCTRKAPQKTTENRNVASAPTMDPSLQPRPTTTPRIRPRPNATPRPNTNPRPAPVVKAPQADQATVAAASTRFAVDLYTKLRRKKGNLFFSPWSINTAVGMTYGGAKGTTATQMAKVMHYTLAQSRLHAAIGAVQGQLGAGKGYELAIANRVYGQKGLALRPGYVSLLTRSYGSTLRRLNFQENPDAARKIINDWVKKRTKDRIPKLLRQPDIKKDTRMVLVNAIYFKGSWASKFDKKNTQPRDFQVTAAKKVKTPTMFQQSKFGYRSHADVDVLEMGYVGKRLSMVVLLPKKVNGLAALEKSLTAQRLTELTANLRKQKVRVFLPRFKLESHVRLKKQLAALGMPIAFSDGADFSGMEPKRLLKISNVIHQANCDVTEKGTVAAAATAVIMKLRGGRVRPPAVPTFRADHPFLFLIRDTKTGAILFLGRLSQPK